MTVKETAYRWWELLVVYWTFSIAFSISTIQLIQTKKLRQLTWQVHITPKTFIYNSKMCVKSNGNNWIITLTYKGWKNYHKIRTKFPTIFIILKETMENSNLRVVVNSKKQKANPYYIVRFSVIYQFLQYRIGMNSSIGQKHIWLLQKFLFINFYLLNTPTTSWPTEKVQETIISLLPKYQKTLL